MWVSLILIAEKTDRVLRALISGATDNQIELERLGNWFAEPLGQQVLATEQAIVDQLLGTLFGYNLLQLSVQGQLLHGESPIRNKIAIAMAEGAPGGLVAAPNLLPFEDDTIDVALVHHGLDFVDNPHQVLRELSRVVLPMGHIVIIGFNPVSLWGIWKLIAGSRQEDRPPWHGQFIRPDRLMDWMNLLNFRIDRAQYCQYGLPRARRRHREPDYSMGLSRNANLPFGGVYIIVARKHVGTLTAIRPVWKRREQSFGRLGVVRSFNQDVAQRTTPPSTPPAKD